MSGRGFLFTSWGALGAVDVGVLHALTDAGQRFDLVAGEGSGGASAAALTAGYDAHQLARLWLDASAGRGGWFCQRMHPLRLLWSGGEIFHLRRDLWRLLGWEAPYRLTPLANFLELRLDEEAVRQATTQLVLATWDLDQGERCIWGNDWFLRDHVLASASTPHLFAPVSLERHRHCDPTLLAEHSLLATLALGNHGLDEIVFPLPRLRPVEGEHSWARTLATSWLLGLRARLERDLAKLRALPAGRVPKLTPIEFDAAVSTSAPLDWRSPSLHRLLDLGYDSTKAATTSPDARKAEETAVEAPAPDEGRPRPRRAAPSRKPRRKAKATVQRLRKRIRKTSGRQRKEPSLGF
jgi:hypothetical protein